MTAGSALYKVHDGSVRIPVARRDVSRVTFSRSHVTLELISLDDLLTSTVDLFDIESIDLGKAAAKRRRSFGGEPVAELVGRRVKSCVATPDGRLDLRLNGSGGVRAASWNVAFGDGRHWTPHPDGRIAEWRPAEWASEIRRPRPRSAAREQRLESVAPLPLAGQSLQEFSFRNGGVDLLFDIDLEARPDRAIERPPELEVSLKGGVAVGLQAVPINAAVPPSVAPLLALVGVETTGGNARPDGSLEIEFANGLALTAKAREGGEWIVSIPDRRAWYVAKDGSVTCSQPDDPRPLTPSQRARLVRAYLEYSATDRNELFWVTDRLRDLIAHAPDDAYDLIRDLVRHAPDPYVLSIVAAGPLEDLLSDWGELMIDRLEADAREDPKLMAACAGVWQLHMPDEVWERLRSLVSGEAPA